jgi:SAM-dependent methyltransferase
MNKYERINQLVSHLYKNKTGILKSYEAVDIPMHENYFSSGYGELLFDAIPILLSYYEFSKEDTLLDLGSGIGRFCMEIFLATTMKKVIGIELENNRHQIACQVKHLLQKYLSHENKSSRKLIFQQENIANYNFNEASVIYSCSLCFPAKLLKIISTKIEESPNIKAVFSFNPLDLKKLTLKKEISIPTSWSDNEIIYFYSS